MSTDLEIAQRERIERANEAAKTQLDSIKAHFQPMLDSLEQYQVELAADPVALGVAQFNQKIQLLRHNINMASTFLARAVAMKADYRNKVNTLEAALDEKLDNLIELDPEISQIAGMEAKKIAARNRTRYEQRLLFLAKQIFTLVSGYHDAFKVARDNLKDTNGDLMKQLAVIKQQIALGEIPVTTNLPGVSNGGRVSAAEKDLVAEFGDSEGPVSL